MLVQHENRPTEFDARLMRYMPMIQRRARRMERDRDAQQELVQETIAYALSRWQNFREDGGFYNWLVFMMRSLVSAKRKRKKLHVVDVDNLELAGRSIRPSQADYAELSQTLARLTGRDGDVLLRRAMGDELLEIGNDMGISRQRVQQLEKRERARLEGLNAAA